MSPARRPQSPPRRSDRWWLAFAPVPWALYGAAHLAARGYDGWGAWAAAPLFLPALVAAAVLGIMGLVSFALAARGGRPRWAVLVAALIAGSPWVWLWLRALGRG